MLTYSGQLLNVLKHLYFHEWMTLWRVSAPSLRGCRHGCPAASLGTAMTGTVLTSNGKETFQSRYASPWIFGFSNSVLEEGTGITDHLSKNDFTVNLPFSQEHVHWPQPHFPSLVIFCSFTSGISEHQTYFYIHLRFLPKPERSRSSSYYSYELISEKQMSWNHQLSHWSFFKCNLL